MTWCDVAMVWPNCHLLLGICDFGHVQDLSCHSSCASNCGWSCAGPMPRKCPTKWNKPMKRMKLLPHLLGASLAFHWPTKWSTVKENCVKTYQNKKWKMALLTVSTPLVYQGQRDFQSLKSNQTTCQTAKLQGNQMELQLFSSPSVGAHCHDFRAALVVKLADETGIAVWNESPNALQRSNSWFYRCSACFINELRRLSITRSSLFGNAHPRKILNVCLLYTC